MEIKEAVRKVSSLIRKEIFNLNIKKLPDNLNVQGLIEDECGNGTELLRSLLQTIVCGDGSVKM